MKHFILVACLSLPLPTLSQDTVPDESELEEGFSLMEEGAKLLFRGLMSEVEPRIDELSGLVSELEPALEMLATEMGPALLEVIQSLDSVRYYDAPEILPNGDIIIRRKEDAPEYVPPVSDEPEAIDL